MRLTLRTLLAHLDRTLDPEDDAAIAAKLRESEFASKLADRVRACLQSDALEAPSTLATGTADDPNRIGEYLDSVLSSEQVAEVERICLESDAHLAEVAACHQILTLVLAKPAEIPVSLRTKLYDLGQELRFEQNTVNGSFAGAAAPLVPEIAGSGAGTSATGLPTAKSAAVAAPPISPVGLDDSGVSDAPTRLKGEAAVLAASSRAEAAIAGSRRLSPADFSDFSGRPSRLMPWLVSLALVAAFLFVASQAFAPLIQRRAADQEKLLTLGEPAAEPTVDEEPAAVVPPPAVVDPPPSRQPAEPPSAPAVAIPVEPTAPDAATAEPITPEPGTPAPVTPEPITPELPLATDRPAATSPPPKPQPDDSVAETPAVSEVAVPDQTASSGGADPAGDRPPTAAPAAAPTDSPTAPPEPAALDAVTEVGVDAPIVISSDDSLLLIREPQSDTWMLATKDDVVQPESELICPPLYRDRLSLHQQVELTMVGPARLTLREQPGHTAELELEYGRFLLVGLGEQQQQVRIRFEDTDSVLTLTPPQSIAAIEVISLRPPGLDPENENATQRVIQVLAAQGAARWRSDNRPEVTLETGQLLTLARGNQVSLSDVSAIPPWLDEPVEAVASIDSSAREGLRGLVRGNEPIELSLREAMDFRRAEVGALAAQTLLLLDRHDVYFGAEGVFSQVRQRTYWPDHFNAVLAVINRGPQRAAAVRGSIQRMDAAQADEIYRLLWLFSDSQLAAGADQTLVEALDNPNMTIRVLAAENLRHITGNTLLYKPEVETSSRRASDIKKWETRLRRGEIRWSTVPPPAAVRDR